MSSIVILEKMFNGKSLFHKLLTLVFLSLFGQSANAQVDSLLRVGDAHHEAYRFDDALDVYDLILDSVEDSTAVIDSSVLSAVNEKMMLSENGSNMAKFVRTPKAVGKKVFSLDDFYLYYPVQNKSWRSLPNSLDGDDSDKFVRALYAPDWNDVHYYSAKDENGVRNIYMTEMQDTAWTVPCKVEELSTEKSNEIYPMLSPDGKTLYFASDGLYGLGGYDIYRSEWDDAEGRWSVPQNMGMPFSSPKDDFLYVDSEDEKYSLFASNRECSEDSVCLYVIEYERFPLHSALMDPEELLELSKMNAAKKPEEQSAPASQQDNLTNEYWGQMNEVRMLKDSISVISEDLDELRTDLAFSNDEAERFDISAEILELEKRIPALQKDLDLAKLELQKIESQFLKKGIFINPIEKKPIAEKQKKYDFVKQSPGPSLELNIAVPEIKFDYSFRILDEALFAEDQTLPSGVVYQIQLLGGSHKVGVSALKGLSPIYEHRSPSGMYIYRVGRFFNYSEALDCIYKVRDRGFKSAYICAFEDGKEISVSKARTLQEQLKGGFSLCEILIMPDSGELDPSVVEIINNIAVGKDIKRAEAEDGTQTFSVGPFDTQAAADELMSAIQGKVQGVVVSRSVLD